MALLEYLKPFTDKLSEVEESVNSFPVVIKNACNQVLAYVLHQQKRQRYINIGLAVLTVVAPIVLRWIHVI